MKNTARLRDWLMELYETNGSLTPELVKEAARPPISPAHGFVFGLAPADAAEAHYTQMAHKLIQSVRVEVVGNDAQPAKLMRLFVALPGESSRYEYEPLHTIRADPAKFRAAQVEAMRRLKEAEQAVTDLELLAPVQATAVRASRAAKRVREARELVEAAS